MKRYRAIPKEGMNRFDLQKKVPELTPACWIRKRREEQIYLGDFGGIVLHLQSVRNSLNRKKEDTFILVSTDRLLIVKPRAYSLFRMLSSLLAARSKLPSRSAMLFHQCWLQELPIPCLQC